MRRPDILYGYGHIPVSYTHLPGRLCCKQAPHHRKEGIFMELTIRADVSTHMRELKQWLAQTRDEPAEDMNGFFAARVDT